MASWKKLAKALLLADNQIDDQKTQIIRDALFADGTVDKNELEFLQDLRNTAGNCSSAFTQLFLDGVRNHVLEKGKVSGDDAKWLRKAIFADGKIDDSEIQLLKDLQTGARKVSKEFERLYKECVPA